MKRYGIALLGIVLACAYGALAAAEDDGSPVLAAATQERGAATPQVAANKRGISAQVARGVQWLLQHQLSDGGWGQGDESPQMRSGQPAALAATSNVADSSMALLALLRAGHTPSSGAQQAAVRRGVAYVLREIEASDKDSLFVTSVRGTRVQGKIGTYVDTFAGLMLLSEIKGAMPDAAGNRRVDAALAKVLSKIEKNQTADGGFRNQGWAPALTQSLATKGLNRAAQKGQAVSEQVLERAEKNAQGRFDGAGRGFSSDDAAGVDLYSGAGALSAMRDSVSTRKGKYKRWQQQAAEPGSPEATRARRALRESEVAERTANDAEGALIARLDDPAPAMRDREGRWCRPRRWRRAGRPPPAHRACRAAAATGAAGRSGRRRQCR
jgi:hypothetical protein